MQQVSLIIPLAPSVNSCWGFSGHKRFLTLKAREFKAAVAHKVIQQPIRFGDKPLSLTVVIHFSDRRKQDLSNRIKVLEDALVQAGLMDDDSQINEIVVKRGEIIKGGLMKIKIVAID